MPERESKDDASKTADGQPPSKDNGPPAATEKGDEVESKPGLGENQAGFLKDRDGAAG